MTSYRDTISTIFLNTYRTLLSAILIIAVLCGRERSFADFYIFVKNVESNDKNRTSTDFRYEDAFSITIGKYEVFNQMYDEGLSFALPGLVQTNVAGQLTDQMVPQGICKAGDFILISAYNAEESTMPMEEISNSVIYILNEDGRYINTMVLPDANHVGGLAFDGKNIWVAKSSDDCCSIIPYEAFVAAAISGQESWKLDAYVADVDCGRDASFVSFYEGMLWIGTFSEECNEKSEVGVYRIVETLDRVNANEDDITLPLDKIALEEVDCFPLPAKAQGLSVYREGEAQYLVVSTSYGRLNDSAYYQYEITEDKGNMGLEFIGKCTMPPMAEELFSDGQYTYMIFESAATKYSTDTLFHCDYPVDRICVVENSRFIEILSEVGIQ